MARDATTFFFFQEGGTRTQRCRTQLPILHVSARDTTRAVARAAPILTRVGAPTPLRAVGRTLAFIAAVEAVAANVPAAARRPPGECSQAGCLARSRRPPDGSAFRLLQVVEFEWLVRPAFAFACSLRAPDALRIAVGRLLCAFTSAPRWISASASPSPAAALVDCTFGPRWRHSSSPRSPRHSSSPRFPAIGWGFFFSMPAET